MDYNQRMAYRVIHVIATALLLLLAIPALAADPKGPSGSGAIRLVRDGATSLDYTSGVVQVWWNEQWDNICYGSLFDYDEANVICHQLGWNGASGYTSSQHDSNYSDYSLYDLSCDSSKYLNIFQCSYSTYHYYYCNDTDVFVTCYSTRIWDNPYNGQIRLQRGTYSNQGLIEVYCNGEWGTICDDSFGYNEARVVCRQLGYNDYYDHHQISITGNWSQRIWLDDVNCASSSCNCIAECAGCPSAEYHNCVHSEDVVVECSASSSHWYSVAPATTIDTCVPISYDGPNSNGAIRLIRGGITSLDYTSGVVQVWLYGQWSNICYDSLFGYDEAKVICHQLGWSGAYHYYSSYYNQDPMQTQGSCYDSNSNIRSSLYNLRCDSPDYLNIFQCTYSTSSYNYCNKPVIVSCYSTHIWDNPYNGQIRLQHGTYSNQGLVEVYCNGEWDTICNDSFGSNEASVICHQLGYNDYYSYDHLSITGNWSQKIWLNCTSSSYNCIGGCAVGCPVEYSDCLHSRDITVECSISSSRSASTVSTATCLPISYVGGPSGNGAIRLVRLDSTTSLNYTSGVVQVWWNGQWGSICYGYSFDYDEANVICHQLGWSGASSYTFSQHDSRYNYSLYNLNCDNSKYLNIFQCSYITCYGDTDVFVTCHSTRIWDNPYDGQIRLQRGTYSNQGLVEVYCNGEWGTICNDSFGHNEASVICHQLGYNDYYSYDHLSITGNWSQKIWLNCASSSYNCIGGCAVGCPVASAEYSDCLHSRDITVECSISSSNFSASTVSNATCLPISYVGDPSGNGAIRLVRGSTTSLNYTSGVVQVWWNGQWGSICYGYSFGYDEANVICHQLGWSGASGYTSSQHDSSYSNYSLYDLSCDSSKYLNIFQCSFTTYYYYYYSYYCDDADVFVTCYSTRIWDNPYDGQIRLQYGIYSNQGLVEVYCNGEWGTICGDSFGYNQARVVCHQLGYNDYYDYHQISITGNWSKRIWLDCFFPSYNCIAECASCPSAEYHNCVHSEDVIIECSTRLYSVAPATTIDTCVPISYNGPNSNGAIRLVRGGITSLDYTSGVVQVWLDGQWSNICYDSSFGYDEAKVICHQLGWSGAWSGASYLYYGSSYYDSNIRSSLYNLSCDSPDYLNIFQCSYSTSYNYCNEPVIVSCYSTRIWDNPYDGQIRLQHGTYSNQGLVEVYCNGEWGTICDDSFGYNEASVVCHQLGYNDYYSYDHLSITGNWSQKIWLNCTSSSYNCIGGCAVGCPASAEYSDCLHSRDITVECSISSSSFSVSTVSTTCLPISYVDGPSGNGAIRLVRGSTTSPDYTSGVVQVWWNRHWGSICYGYSFGYNEANVICHQLGWSGASGYTSSQHDSSYSNYSLYDLSCDSSKYLNIFQCSYSTYYNNNYYYSYYCDDTDVFVTCYSTRIWDNPYNGQIRLQRGNYSNQGLVEVYCNGEWGTICDDGFGSNKSRVVCRQLGYNDYYDDNHLSIGSSALSNGIRLYSDCASSNSDCISNCGACPSYTSYCQRYEIFTIECTISSNLDKSNNDIYTCESDSASSRSGNIGGIIGGVVGGVIVLLILSIIVPVIVIFVCVCVINKWSSLRRSRGPRYIRVTGSTDTQQLYVPPVQLTDYTAQGSQEMPSTSATSDTLSVSSSMV